MSKNTLAQLFFTSLILLGSLFFRSSSTEAQDRSFEWRSTAALITPADRPNDPCYSVKDPSIVHFNGVNYLFMTIRSLKKTHQIEFTAFADWKDANRAPRKILKMHSGYCCAPQVFYFTPQKKWYMICQAAHPDWNWEYGGHYGAAFSTTENIADPDSWTPLKPMNQKAPYYKDQKKVRPGLDYWVICDEKKAYLFFTTNNGDMWREETSLTAFPYGWSEPELALHGDIFEASHTYKIKGENRYLTIIEAINKHALDSLSDAIKGHRVYKAYTAERLDGKWEPLQNGSNGLFAGTKNVHFDGPIWSESFSHGELLRAGYDEKMEIEPSGWKFLYQGVLDKAISPGKYGEIPWNLGILSED
ncbi:MAG: non-reducing end alpha-L-arabinofuranosidase family hydrolase [Planctomycetia bacterium]|nr:non-reducing end alpha-L-arabinofuranosidase family hydrolase [Planctomycetia bacterium]